MRVPTLAEFMAAMGFAAAPDSRTLTRAQAQKVYRGTRLRKLRTPGKVRCRCVTETGSATCAHERVRFCRRHRRYVCRDCGDYDRKGRA